MTSNSLKKMSFILLGLLAAVALGIGGAKLLQGTSAPSVETLLHQGDEEFAAKNYSEALRFYMEASQQKPNSNQIGDKIKMVDEKIKNLQAGKDTPNSTTTNASISDPAPAATQQTNPDQKTTDSAQKTDKTIPNLVGMTKEQAEQTLLANGIHYQFFVQQSSEPANTVFKQDKEADQPYQAGDRITFYISSGQ